MSGRRLRSGIKYPSIHTMVRDEEMAPNVDNTDMNDIGDNDQEFDELDRQRIVRRRGRPKTNKMYPNIDLEELENNDRPEPRKGFSSEVRHPLNDSKQMNDDFDDNEPQFEAKTEQLKSKYICLLMFVFAVVLALICGYHFFDGKRFFIKNSNQNNSMNGLNEWKVFDNEMKTFEQKYSEVLPQFGLKVLRIAVKNVMIRKDSPAVVLLIGSKDNQNVLNCIERDFTKSVNKAFNEKNSLKFNGNKYSSKEEIVEMFEQNFGSDKKHTIVVENIDSILPEDVLSLHQFTDHQNAKYKDVVIVLTAIHFQDIELTKSAQLVDMDSIATQLFQMKWKDSLREEQYFPLISRLTTSVVTIIGKDNQIKC